MTAPSTPPTSTQNHLVLFMQALLKMLDPAGSTTQKVTSYIADVLGTLGGLVGIFNHQWGIDLGTVPQSVLIGISAVVILGINAYRLYTNQKIALAKAVAFEHAALLALNSRTVEAAPASAAAAGDPTLVSAGASGALPEAPTA